MTTEWRWLRLAVFASLTVAAGCGLVNRHRETHWATRADAVADGALTPGRLPAWIPPGAHDLKERRDTRQGGLWVRFDITPADRDAVLHACTSVPPIEVTRPASARGVAWWPTMLQGDLGRAAVQFDFARCTAGGGEGWLAVHRAMPWVFYWEVRR
ncbi:MAG: hypothetical protein KJ061_01385 [Vicinamibacteraceae bacterium]|nr:hypothetical protein [Vicinamibacteraceae bacterium]